jgi:tetratricopeptide (TPR) repeat protein
LKGDAAVEAEQKIRYYRLALSLEPDSSETLDKLAEALEASGRQADLAELLEERIAKEPGAPEVYDRLMNLTGRYRELGDGKKRIFALERLMPLAEARGVPLEGFQASLAALWRAEEPLKAAGIYEELVDSADPERRRAYLNELATIYREQSLTIQEIEVWEKLLGVVSPEEAPLVWSQLLSLRERLSDGPGLRAAWAGLAESMPDGTEKANAYKRLAYLWYLEENLGEAEKAYRQALLYDENDWTLYLNLARLASASADREGYRQNLEKALALEPDPDLTRELAQAYAQDGRPDQAVPLWLGLAEKEALTPEDQAKRRDDAARLLELLRPPEGEMNPAFEERLYQFSDQAVEFYNLGVAHYKAGDWPGAIKAFSKALELPHDGELTADVRGYLVAAYREAGQIKEMLQEAMLLYQETPSNKLMRDLVVGHMESDRNWAGLAEAAKKWTDWQPQDPDNWRYLALSQKNIGRAEDEAKSLLKIAQLLPNEAAGWFAAAEALEKTGDKESAKQAYQKVMELEPENAKAESALLRLALEALPGGSGRNRSPG